MILAYLHKIKVVEVVLVIANVQPAELRAKAAKFIFEKMGAPDVPVAVGSDSTDKAIKLHDYEFKGIDEIQGTILYRKTTIVEKLEALEIKKEQCNIIVITSLRDLSELIKQHKSLVKTTISKFFFQGAWKTDHEQVETLIPDIQATNNKYNHNTTTYIYNWLRRGNISTYTTTRFSAVKATIDSQVFREAADRGHIAAQYIYKAFGEQERKFYEDAIKPPGERHMLHIDLGWFTNRHSYWRKAHGDILPETLEDIQPFFRMILYDIVAGLICPLLEYDFVKYVYQPYQGGIWIGEKEVYHYIIGRPADGPEKTIPDVNPELLSNIITQLLQEAFSN
jgi:hypothetical protein